MTELKSWVRENSTLVYFLVAQAIAIGAAGVSIIAYSVRLETRVKRDPEHPLTDQRHYLVLNEFRTSHVVKARRKPIHHPDGAICRT